MNHAINFSAIRAVLFDMDGVVYRGKTRLPGVVEMMTFCDEQAIAYACMTNNASMTPHQIQQKLAAMDIAIPLDRLLSSALLAKHYLQSTYPKGTTAYVVGMSGLRDAIYGDGYFAEEATNPELVVLGVDLHVTYEKLKIAALAIRKGARFIVTNPDKVFPSEEGLLPGAGALAAFVQSATDVEPFIIGKPQPTIFHIALDMLHTTANTTLMIGDRLETDIFGAKNAGLLSVLVLTGVTTREQLATSPYQPDGVFENLLDLLQVWKHYG